MQGKAIFIGGANKKNSFSGGTKQKHLKIKKLPNLQNKSPQR